MTKLQSQVRAELSWLWQKEDTNDVQTSSGSVRFRANQTDSNNNRIEGIWKKCNQTLQAGSSVNYELDYLTRDVLGGNLDIGFLDIRTILISNNSSSGTIIVSPGDQSAWKGIWNNTDGQNMVPPCGSMFICAGSSPWSISLINNKLKLTAITSDCNYDIAVIGRIADYPSSSSSTSSSSSASSASSSSSSCSSSSSSSSSSASSASSSGSVSSYPDSSGSYYPGSASSYSSSESYSG